MGTGIHAVLTTVGVGIGATLVMDGWNQLLKRRFGIPSLDFCLLGRWVRHMERGRFRHARIVDAGPKPGECAVGWLTHYSIGIGLAFGFVALASSRWLADPTPLPAVAYGAGTVAAPFLILQPAFGLGIAGSKAASPRRARLKSLATHTVYGLGLYVAAWVASSLP